MSPTTPFDQEAFSKLLQTSYDKLIHELKSYHHEADETLVRKAFDFASKAHSAQKRSSGEPYIIHPLEVAISLAELRLDLSSVLSGLLHDTVEDTSTTLDDLRNEFGSDVAEIVDGVTKLSKISFRTTEEKQAENFRKMILAMSKDIRVILVKLADRLNNMRTLHHLSQEKQQRIAQETLDIYAPIANRLGISGFKLELEDLCFKSLKPEAYERIARGVEQLSTKKEKFIDGFIHQLHEHLKEYEITAQIAGRAKHYYSIYKKMERRNIDLDQIHDLIAFRILVENITECYKALGVIHAAYKPIPGRFKDYIAIPKANQYQSLHTSVIGPDGDRIEIQIRTFEMNLVAEKGIAAHWAYKEGKSVASQKDGISWINRLLEWNRDLSDPNEFLETVKIDLFAEDVFVFTPEGEVKELPFGATPLDFAYAVHTNVGNRCSGAKVNGKIVPLKHRLKSGDTIEILTAANQTPSKDWLQLVKTSRAKAKIRAFIKEKERALAIEKGREILERALKPFGRTLKHFDKAKDELSRAFDVFNCKSLDELALGIGYGRFWIEKVIELIIPKEEFKPEAEKEQLLKDEKVLKKIQQNYPKKQSDPKNAVLVTGLDGVMIRFGRCCNPLPGDSIVGFISRGRGVSIHSATCPKAIDYDQERRVPVAWNQASIAAGLRRQVRIRVFCNDDTGLLASMSQAITSCGVNIVSANIRTTKDKKAIALFEVEVANIPQLAKVTSALEGSKGVLSVERVRN